MLFTFFFSHGLFSQGLVFNPLVFNLYCFDLAIFTWHWAVLIDPIRADFTILPCCISDLQMNLLFADIKQIHAYFAPCDCTIHGFITHRSKFLSIHGLFFSGSKSSKITLNLSMYQAKEKQIVLSEVYLFSGANQTLA